MSQDEEVIRKEADQFYEWKLKRITQAINSFHDLKSRLTDFYTPLNKAIFLDQIQKQITEGLFEHRRLKHGGKSSPTCQVEIDAEKLLFYIRQEIETFPQIAYQKFDAHSGKVRNKVFVSYCHQDKEHLADIKRHFKPFLSHIDFWDDTKIEAGKKWKQEIRNAIDQTKIAILLVSTDFLGSEFIATDELPPLLKAAEEDGAVILIVILKPCLFEDFPDLNQYQAMNPPSNTVLKMDQLEKEELYVNLVRQVKRILSDTV